MRPSNTNNKNSLLPHNRIILICTRHYPTLGRKLSTSSWVLAVARSGIMMWRLDYRWPSFPFSLRPIIIYVGRLIFSSVDSFHRTTLEASASTKMVRIAMLWMRERWIGMWVLSLAYVSSLEWPWIHEVAMLAAVDEVSAIPATTECCCDCATVPAMLSVYEQVYVNADVNWATAQPRWRVDNK